MLFNSDPKNAFLLTNYAGLLRRTEQPGAALALMRKYGDRFEGRRDVFYEWSVGAGLAGDYGMNVWLAARSIADDQSVPFRPDNIKLALSGLGVAFGKLAASTGRREFAATQAACGRLGLRLADLDPKARGYFEQYIEATPSFGGILPSIKKDVETVSRSVVEASYEAMPENSHELETVIGEPDSYGYKMLTTALSGENGACRNVRR